MKQYTKLEKEFEIEVVRKLVFRVPVIADTRSVAKRYAVEVVEDLIDEEKLGKDYSLLLGDDKIYVVSSDIVLKRRPGTEDDREFAITLENFPEKEN